MYYVFVHIVLAIVYVRHSTSLGIRVRLTRKSRFKPVVGNAERERDLFHAPPSPLGVVLELARRLLQDPAPIELA